MTNNKPETAVDSIIEFCQKQMDNDSSIHKGVYLSIIKFCKEQITEESEVHWKTTLITSKPMEMTNNKQQTAVDYMESVSEELRLNGVENVVINGGTINITSLGVSMRYDYAHRPNIMADVYRCLSHLGLRIHNVHLSNKLQSINTYGGNK